MACFVRPDEAGHLGQCGVQADLQAGDVVDLRLIFGGPQHGRTIPATVSSDHPFFATDEALLVQERSGLGSEFLRTRHR